MCLTRSKLESIIVLHFISFVLINSDNKINHRERKFYSISYLLYISLIVYESLLRVFLVDSIFHCLYPQVFKMSPKTIELVSRIQLLSIQKNYSTNKLASNHPKKMRLDFYLRLIIQLI